MRRINWPGAAVIVGFLALWQVLVWSAALHVQYLPSPSEIVVSLVQLLGQGAILVDLGHTLVVVIEAWVIAVAMGGILGVVLGQFSWAQRLTGSSVEILRTLPVVAFVPVVLLIFGPTSQSELVVAAYVAIWPMIINVAGGVARVPARLFDVAVTFRLSRFDQARKILFPSVLPSALVGARLALSLSLVITVVSEMIGNPQGLGYGLVHWQFALRPDAMWAYIVVIGTVGFVLNAALMWSARKTLVGTREIPQ